MRRRPVTLGRVVAPVLATTASADNLKGPGRHQDTTHQPASPAPIPTGRLFGEVTPGPRPNATTPRTRRTQARRHPPLDRKRIRSFLAHLAIRTAMSDSRVLERAAARRRGVLQAPILSHDRHRRQRWRWSRWSRCVIGGRVRTLGVSFSDTWCPALVGRRPLSDSGLIECWAHGEVAGAGSPSERAWCDAPDRRLGADGVGRLALTVRHRTLAADRRTAGLPTWSSRPKCSASTHVARVVVCGDIYVHARRRPVFEEGRPRIWSAR